jgi:AcrR family transcriptional regulator
MITDTSNLRQQAESMIRQGMTKAEVAKKLGISRPTLYKLLGSKEEMGKKEITELDSIVEREVEAAKNIQEKLKNPYYGRVMEEVYAKYGVTLMEGDWDKVIELADEYGVMRLALYAPMIDALQELGLDESDLSEKAVEVIRYFAKLPRSIWDSICQDIPYIDSYRNFINSPTIKSVLDTFAYRGEEGRAYAFNVAMNTMINLVEHREGIKEEIKTVEARLKELNDEIAEMEKKLEEKREQLRVLEAEGTKSSSEAMS